MDAKRCRAALATAVHKGRRKFDGACGKSARDEAKQKCLKPLAAKLSVGSLVQKLSIIAATTGPPHPRKGWYLK